MSESTPATDSVDEVAGRLGIHRLTMYSAIKRNEVPFPIIRIGRRIVVPREAFDRVMAGVTEGGDVP